MAASSSPASGGVPATKADSLLLVTAEEYGAHAELARRLSERSGIEVSLLPLGPHTHTALAAVVAGAPARVVAVPLTWGANDSLLTDLTGLLRSAKARWPDIAILQTAPLGTMEHLVGWAAQRVRAASARQASQSPPERTALLVVGPGGPSPAMNADVCAIARLMWERTDFGLVETAFLHENERRPSITTRIRHCRQLGLRHVIVAPISLLDDSITCVVRAQAEASHDIEVTVTEPLLSSGGAAAIVLERYREALTTWLAEGDDGLLPRHGHAHGEEPSLARDSMLPPRYRNGKNASPTPMRSASLLYDDEGRVAWNEVWRSFCDLALAGGPPHRGTLLEPAVREEVQADRAEYERVVSEIARGLSLITRLPIITDATPGWVGLVCPDEEMAIWMLRAIIVENVSVRREGATLFLPAGPRYRVEKEIKNVITAVAKTHHYWTEHRAAR